MSYLNVFYGELTTGAGKRLKNPSKILNNFADKNVIDEFEKSITKDLANAKINFQNNKDLKILDIGTGRQSLAFSNIFNGTVHHFDINKENVKNLKKIIKKKN